MTIDGETIETTKEHQFWIEGQGWTKAKFLKAGDQLRDADGNSLIIDNVEIVSLPENQYTLVYNLEVADFHTYYVANSNILVHNDCTVKTKEIHFMQDSIKNKTGNHTVLQNAKDLKNGKLKVTDFEPIRVWKDENNKIWSLDHRRLAAFKMAGIEEIPVKWASKSTVAKEMWKMTTKTNGESIILKVAPGVTRTIYK